MFGDWLLNVAAHMAGLNDAQLRKIEAALPATRKLIGLITKAQPLIEKVIPEIDELMPIISQMMPLVDGVANDMQTVGPALEIILDVVEKHVASGKSRDQAIAAIHSTLSHFE